jgi:transcriptional regulator with XRE-family HTH domain
MAHTTSSSRVPVFSLGERIRKVRADLGLSQQAFADLLSIDRKTVSNWEGGRNRPRYGDLMLIASVANVSLQWLAAEEFRPTFGAVGADVGGDIRDSQTRSNRGLVTSRPGYTFDSNLVELPNWAFEQSADIPLAA